MCCHGFRRAAERQFDARVAQRDLARYRRRGPGATTRLLRDGVRQASPPGGTLLDIGAGIGALTFELLDTGIRFAMGVDASAPYLEAAQQETARRDCTARVRWVHGDFVQLARELPGADVVTLDRVVCCYPDFEALLHEALRRAGTCFALSYPRYRWYVRAVIGLDNTRRRMFGNSFHTYVHPPAAMEQLVQWHGFRRVSRHTTLAWCVDVYTREGKG